MELFPIMFRVMCTVGDWKRDRKLKEPQDVQAYKDLAYAQGGKNHQLDLYMPKEAKKPLPVIVSVHGGGYIYGTKKIYVHYGMFLAQQGFAVVNFNYTLAPKKKFPGQLEEVNMVMNWIVENSEKYGLDLDHMFIVGDSAGAQMASHYLTIYSNPEFAKLFPFSIPKQCKIKAVALNCGMYDISDNAQEFFDHIKEQSNLDSNLLCKLYLDEKTKPSDERLQVLKYITKDFPPAYVMTAQYDFLKDAAKPMYELLQERGVPAEYHLYGTEDQPYMAHVFHVNMNLQEAKECNRDTCRFFREHYGID